MRWGRFEVYASEAVQAEIEPAPIERKAKMLALWSDVSPTLLGNSPEVERLSKIYLKKGKSL